MTGRCPDPARLLLSEPLLLHETGCGRAGPALPCRRRPLGAPAAAARPAIVGGMEGESTSALLSGFVFGALAFQHLSTDSDTVGAGGPAAGRGGRGRDAGGTSRDAGPLPFPSGGRAASRCRPAGTPLPGRAPRPSRASPRAVLEHGFAAYSLPAAMEVAFCAD